MCVGPLYQIEPARDLALAETYRRNLDGPHSPDLLRLLNCLRWEPMDEKHVLICLERHRRWIIGTLRAGRGTPVELDEDHVYTSRQEAEWAVFKRRWKKATGQDLPIA